MSNAPRTIIRHAIAACGSLIVLVLVMFFVNPLVNCLLTDTLVTDSLEATASCFWCCRSILWIIAVFLPASLVAESLLVEQFELHWWVHVPAMAILFFGVGALLMGFFSLAIAGQWTDSLAMLIVGLDDSLWGASYWCLLRISERILNRK